MPGIEDYARRFGAWFGGSGQKVGQVAPPPTSLGTDAVSPEGMDAYRRWRDEPGQGALEKLGAAFPQDTGLTGGSVAQVAPPPTSLGPQQQAALEPFTNFGGTFGGEGAATADLAALGRAKGMETAGHDAPSVWRETGWFKGPEDRWKHEIDDSYSFLEHPENAPKGYERLQHPDVQDAYPSLWNNLQQSISPAPQRSGLFLDGDTLVARGPTEADRRSVALHELQHAIQGREGFAPGGNPAGMSFDAYRNLAGEAEARAVQARADMTAEQRRATFPLDSYDVPRDRLVGLVRGGGR